MPTKEVSVDEGYDFICRYYMWGMSIVEFDC